MTDHRDRASELLNLLEAGGRSAADHDRITRATSAHLLAAIHDLLDERLPKQDRKMQVTIKPPVLEEYRAAFERAATSTGRAGDESDADTTRAPVDPPAPGSAPQADAGIDPDSITEWTWCLVKTSDGYDRLRQVRGGQMREGPGGSASPFPDHWTIVTDDVWFGKGRGEPVRLASGGAS